MVRSYIQACKDHFELDGKSIMLRGWALGSWMNLEHFMVGLPGTNSMILDAFSDVYGKENAEIFTDKLLRSMVSEKDIAYLKSLGINTIRIPFGYHYFIDDEAPDEILDTGFRYLDPVIRMCEENDLYVVLDLHSVPGSQNTDWHSDNITGQQLFWNYRVFQDQVVRLWRALADHYKDNPYIIGYDIINEPGFDVTCPQINGFYRRIHQTIREVDPNHILFLEGTDFGRDFSVIEEIEDPQIAYTVHFYPFVLEDNILDPAMDPQRRTEIFTEIFERQIEATKNLNHPLWCGESGYEILDGQEEFYSMLLLKNIGLYEDRGISWNLWTYKDARCMGIVIPKENSKWMELFRQVQEKWSHHREEMISMKMTKEIGERFYEPLEEHLAYELDFRVRSVLHVIGVEQVLKPILRSIPFDEMLTYPESFLYENCDRRSVVAENIKRRIEGVKA